MAYTTNNYPTSIQDPVDPIASDNTSAFDHAGLETFQNESIKALKDKVGADGSAVTTSHDYKLSEVTDKAVGKTATQTLTNKTLTAPTVNTPTITDASLSGDTQIDIGSDATGDLLVRKSTGKLGRIAAGTAKQMLVANGTGTEPTYQDLDAVLPAQTGNSGKYFTTNGTTASWGDIQQTLQFTAGENITANDALCAWYSQADGGIQVDTTATRIHANGTSATFNDTISLTVGSNSNRAIVFILNTQRSAGSNSQITVTHNGSTISPVYTIGNSGANPNYYTTRIYVVFNAPTGFNSFNVDGASNGQNWAANSAVYSVYNVSNTTVDAVLGVSDWATTTTNTLTQTTAGGAIFTTAVYSSLPTFSDNAQSSQLSVNTSPNFAAFGFSGTSVLAGSKTVTASSSVSIVSVILKPETVPTFTNLIAVKASASTPTNSCNLNKYTGFIGFAGQTATSGNTLPVNFIGAKTGLSSLSLNSTYFLSNTAGAISTTAGSNSKKVGVAIGSTTLLIKNDNV